MQKEKDMEMLIAYRNSNLGGQKGSKIGIQSRNPIYKNILDDLICGINQKASKRDLRKILKKYYPDNKPTTLETKIGIYKKFIIQHYLSRIRISSTSSNSIFKNI